MMSIFLRLILKFFKDLFLFYAYRCLSCTRVMVPCMCSAREVQKRTLDPLELEWQLLVAV